MACSSGSEKSATDKSSSTQSEKRNEKNPTCVIVLGMAGSGKTTFVQVTILSQEVFVRSVIIKFISGFHSKMKQKCYL
jgi:polynucleotide 5'-kinase involved in rRNA processing